MVPLYVLAALVPLYVLAALVPLYVLADLADGPPVQHRAHLHRVLLVPLQALAALGVNERRKQYE